MIYTTEVFELEDQTLALAQKIIESNNAKDYVEQLFQVHFDPESCQKEKSFREAKEQFERIEAYGQYAPDFNEKRRLVRKAKRALDMDQNVAAFRISETTLQDVLDHVGYELATSISEDIKVSAGNPFFEMARSGCGGSCHVG